MVSHRIDLFGNDEQHARLAELLRADYKHIAISRLADELSKIKGLIYLDELVLWEPYIIWYRTRGIGGAWVKARDFVEPDREKALAYKASLELHFGPGTEYIMTHETEDPNA